MFLRKVSLAATVINAAPSDSGFRKKAVSLVSIEFEGDRSEEPGQKGARALRQDAMVL